MKTSTRNDSSWTRLRPFLLTTLTSRGHMRFAWLHELCHVGQLDFLVTHWLTNTVDAKKRVQPEKVSWFCLDTALECNEVYSLVLPWWSDHPLFPSINPFSMPLIFTWIAGEWGLSLVILSERPHSLERLEWVSGRLNLIEHVWTVYDVSW